MVSIFIWKYERNDWHFSAMIGEGVFSCGLRSVFIVFIVENRALGLLEPDGRGGKFL